jgi:hypothetical protein
VCICAFINGRPFSHTRSAVETAATRRGWVTPISPTPAAPKPYSNKNCGTCVDLPDLTLYMKRHAQDQDKKKVTRRQTPLAVCVCVLFFFFARALLARDDTTKKQPKTA